MQENQLFDLVMYLFEQHVQADCQFNADSDVIFAQFEALGFQKKLIREAYVWLQDLLHRANTTESFVTQNTSAIRIYEAHECRVLDVACRSFLMDLECKKILTPISRELVIQKLMELDLLVCTEHLIKWGALLVLLARREEADGLILMERFVLDCPDIYLH